VAIPGVESDARDPALKALNPYFDWDMPPIWDLATVRSLVARSELKLIGEDFVLGRRVMVVERRGPEFDPFIQRVWLTPDHGIIIREQYYGPRNDPGLGSELRCGEPKFGPIAPSELTFRPPPTALRSVHREVAFNPADGADLAYRAAGYRPLVLGSAGRGIKGEASVFLEATVGEAAPNSALSRMFIQQLLYLGHRAFIYQMRDDLETPIRHMEEWVSARHPNSRLVRNVRRAVLPGEPESFTWSARHTWLGDDERVLTWLDEASGVRLVIAGLGMDDPELLEIAAALRPVPGNPDGPPLPAVQPVSIAPDE
jgi:hypothetical protein